MLSRYLEQGDDGLFEVLSQNSLRETEWNHEKLQTK